MLDITEVRGAIYNAHGGIDAEINHPELGWIPCSLHPNDAPTAGLYAQAIADELLVIAPYVPNLPALRTAKWQNIKAKRDYLSENGGQLVGTKWFHSDVASRTQQLGLVMMGAGIPAGLQWKTMDGTFVEMTPTLAGQILAAAAAMQAALFTAAEAHRIAMEAAADPAAYDFSAGWPATFLDVPQ